MACHQVSLKAGLEGSSMKALSEGKKVLQYQALGICPVCSHIEAPGGCSHQCSFEAGLKGCSNEAMFEGNQVLQ